MGLLIFASPSRENRKTIQICNSSAIRKCSLRESVSNPSGDENPTVSLLLKIIVQEDTGNMSHTLAEITTSDESELAAVKEKASQIASLLAGRVDCVDLDNSGILPEDKKGV